MITARLPGVGLGGVDAIARVVHCLAIQHHRAQLPEQFTEGPRRLVARAYRELFRELRQLMAADA